jgi:hypothetical protein
VAQTAGGIWEMNNFELGVGYTLAPGLQLYEAAFYYNDYNTHVPAGSPGNLRNRPGLLDGRLRRLVKYDQRRARAPAVGRSRCRVTAAAKKDRCTSEPILLKR